MDDQTTRVLLIEDNPGDADLIRLRLVEGQSSVKVDCVNRLSDGLASMTNEMPSLVLLDLNLPDSHGAETFRRVMKHSPNTPVVILSGQDDEGLAIKAVHQGVQDYLIKGDVTSKQLERAIRYAVERQALLRSLEISQKQQLDFKNQFPVPRFPRAANAAYLHSPVRHSAFGWIGWGGGAGTSRPSEDDLEK